jgi:hypothetical protein
MKLGKYNLGSRHSLSFHDVRGDSSAIVFNSNTIVYVDGNADAGAKPSQCFVYRVIDNLKNEMVESSFGGVSDVHPWSFTNCL